jgi:ribosomal protein S20
MAQAAGSKVKKRKKSVLKRSRQYRERELVNRHNRTQVRTSIAKGVLTENTGNRYKSRLSLAFNALNAAKKA